MIDYKDHNAVLNELTSTQDNSADMYEAVRKCQYFLEKEDGQWDPEIIRSLAGRPRYTDDRCNPLVDAIAGEMEQNEFAIHVKPASGAASKENAEVLEGLIRNIENISSASLIYSAVCRSMVGAGFAAFEITQDYIDADTFDQDLFIRPLEDAQNRVWFDDNAKMQDKSDAKFCWVLDDITRSEYEDKFPDGKMQSIGDSRSTDVYYDKPDFITVARYFYKKPIDINIVRMSNGAVYKVDDNFLTIADELAAQGITVEAERTRKSHKVCVRVMDGGGWLNESEETVFNMLPIVPVYANYKIIDGKTVFRGAINKAMDMQQVHNMAVSREVEEVALSPRQKYWGTPEQRKGHNGTLSKLNTSADSWQDYNHVDGQPAPYIQGGAQVNPALSMLSQISAESINLSAGVFSSQLGMNPGLQSGVALEKQINKGDISSLKYFSSLEAAIKYAGKVIINAIPLVYDGMRQARILSEDGTMEMVTLNQPTIDEQTGQPIILNDLTIGEYDCVVEIGPAFNSKQEQAADAFARIAAIDPTVMELGRDIWFRNLNQPGMDDVASRARVIAISNGLVPQDQLTDEELAQQQEQQQNQQQQPDPMMVAAEAEMQKAQADMANAQVKGQQAQFEQQVKIEQISFEREKLQLEIQKFMREKDDKYNVEAAKINQGQQKIDLDTSKMINDFALKLADLEAKMGQQLDAQVQANMLTVEKAE